MQHLADKAKLLRKEAKGVQHMVMKDEVRVGSLECRDCAWFASVTLHSKIRFPAVVKTRPCM